GAERHPGAQGRGRHGDRLAYSGTPEHRGGGDQALRRGPDLGRAGRRGRAARRDNHGGRPDLSGRGGEGAGLPGHPRRPRAARGHGRIPQGGAQERGRHRRRGDDGRPRNRYPRSDPRRDRDRHGRQAQEDIARRRGRAARRGDNPHGYPHPPRPQAPPL
ncbi:MAG: CBS domain protein sometimes clustered with YjeE, partial [uncultured Rubrobacteraceae bacterium]